MDSCDSDRIRADRRTMLTTIAGGFAALAGCTDEERSTPAATTTRTRTPSETATPEQGTPPSGVSSLDAGINEWGRHLNAHAEQADIDWQQFEGEGIELTFGVNLHPYSVTFSRETSDGTQLNDYFEELTGITVNYELVADDQYWLETEAALGSDDNPYDGVVCNLWPAGQYHYGTDGDPWVRDLQQYIDDASLTDREWLAMDDFDDRTVELLTFPDGAGGEAFVGFPNTVDVFGCVAIHGPTFQTLGLSAPTDFEELESAARQIAESDELDRDGIVSRTYSDTQSSANWGTMFNTYGADWIDRESRTAALNSAEGVESLEQFAGMLSDYGPDPPETDDWYAAQDHYSNEDVGILYGSPQYSGIVDDEVMAETRWLAPLAGPDGESPVVNTSIWSTAITATTDHPEAAWLYIQWANSRDANLLLSTHQWEGDVPRAGFARLDYVDEQIQAGNAPDISGGEYISATRTALSNAPGGDPSSPDEHPPVPADTTRCMDIMSEAAMAMSDAVDDGPSTAQSALDDVADSVTSHAEDIPDRYL